MIYINEKLRYKDLRHYFILKYDWHITIFNVIHYRNAFKPHHMYGYKGIPKTIISFNVLKYMT